MGTSPGGYIPPVGFHFKVEFVGIGNNNDARFQTVTGLTIEYETEPWKEGGQNRYEHKLPVRTRFPDAAVFKRGMLTDSAVIKWFNDTFKKRVIKPITVIVTLLNEKHQPLRTWNIVDAWPRKWSVSEFNAQENNLAIETLELNYAYFTIL
jgi:phage tail-like protein